MVRLLASACRYTTTTAMLIIMIMITMIAVTMATIK